MVELLLTSGANPDSRTGNGDSPLMSAIEHDREPVVAKLIEYGAAVEMVNLPGGNASCPGVPAGENRDCTALAGGRGASRCR